MAFADDETSVETSQPREFYEIVHGATSYYVASGDRTITYNGHAFVATPSSRLEVAVSAVSATWEFVLALPASHALARRYVAMGGVPPQKILVTARRMQLNSGQVQQLHVGYVTSVSFDGHLAKFAVPGRVRAAMTRPLPTVLVDTRCGNVLYDAWCTVSRAANTVTTTITGTDGRIVFVSSVGGNPDGWYTYGELVHVPSGESMGIIDHTGGRITMQYPIAELLPGDSVQLVAGCDHLIGTCKTKYNNVVNFSGLPQRPTTNIHNPTGLGVEVG